MSDSCCSNQPRFDGVSEGFRRALWAVIAINAAMFVVEMAAAALFKGISLGAMGILVLGLTAYRVFVTGVPDAPMMGVIGFLALVANMASVLILMRYRDGDANVRSVWLCSRNDAIGNVAVIVAAGAVWLTATPWPDLIVAGLMAGLFLRSATQIIGQAVEERREANALAAE